MKKHCLGLLLALASCNHPPIVHQVDGSSPTPPPTPVVTVDAAPDDGGDPGDANVCETSCPMPQHILIVGDSEAGYVSRCVNDKKCIDAIRHPWEFLDMDYKGGTTVQQWSAGGRFAAALDRYAAIHAVKQPDTVIIFLGTNNYWNKTAPDASAILNVVKQKGINCVWVGPTSVQGKSWPVNDMLRQEVQGTCKYFDTEAADIPLEDSVHPTPAGIVKWLKAIWYAKDT